VRSHKIVAVAAAAGAVVILSWSATPGAQGRGGANPLASEPAPKLADGTVNLGRVPGEKGYWNTPYITNMGARVIDPSTGKPFPLVQKGPAPARGARGAEIAPAGGGEGGGGGGRGGAAAEPFVPFQPWAAAVYNYNTKNQSHYDPEGFCLPPGGPRLMATPYPMEIIQLPEQKRVIMVFEGATHIWREIYTDGRPHPTGDELNPTYLGHSVGHYEDNGNTLVVDVVGFNEFQWVDYFGHPHTDLLHVVEKFSRPNKGTLHYEAMFDDPGAYTKPFNVAWTLRGTRPAKSRISARRTIRLFLAITDDFANQSSSVEPRTQSRSSANELRQKKARHPREPRLCFELWALGFWTCQKPRA
jgi:hypothetical protein